MAKTQATQRKRDEDIVYVGPIGPTFLKAWRKWKGVTQVDLAHDVQVSNGTVSEIENGNTPYHQGYLEAVSRRLGVHICDLLCRDPNEGEGIWTLWERADDKQRRHIVGMVAGYMGSSNK